MTFHCTYTCTSIYCNFCSDDDFELPVISKAAQKEITQQLIKDGYNLDLEPDDEDLDLIPPRPVNERCTCCNYYTGYCAIQWKVLTEKEDCFEWVEKWNEWVGWELHVYVTISSVLFILIKFYTYIGINCHYNLTPNQTTCILMFKDNVYPFLFYSFKYLVLLPIYICVGVCNSYNYLNISYFL